MTISTLAISCGAMRATNTAVAFLLSCSAFSAASAQVRPITRDTGMTHAPAMRMPHGDGMTAMMSGPHHALAAAYRDNVAVFARALNREVTRTQAVDGALSQPATGEMRRSFDLMKQHHQAQMSAMGTQMTMPIPKDSTMSGMMRSMNAHMADLDLHLTALEAEITTSAPSPARVMEHTAAILKQCEGMMPMPTKVAVKAGGAD